MSKDSEREWEGVTIFYTKTVIFPLVFMNLIFQIDIRRSREKFAKHDNRVESGRKGSEMKKSIVFLLHALAGWIGCGAVMAVGMRLLSLQDALLVHLFAAPLIFALISLSYHKKAPSAHPLPVAAGFTVIVMAMDFFLVAMVIQKSFEMFRSTMGTWVPFGTIFISSWMTGWSMKKPRDSTKKQE